MSTLSRIPADDFFVTKKCFSSMISSPPAIRPIHFENCSKKQEPRKSLVIFSQARRFRLAKKNRTWYARVMSPDQLPVILSVQSKLLDSITTEQAYTIEKIFREGTSIREIAQNFLPRDEIGVASNTIRQLLIERIPEDEYTTLIQ